MMTPHKVTVVCVPYRSLDGRSEFIKYAYTAAFCQQINVLSLHAPAIGRRPAFGATSKTTASVVMSHSHHGVPGQSVRDNGA